MRTMAQRMRDDEDHRLALCGLSFDARVEHELEDQASRHFDFIFTQGPGYDYWVNGGGQLAMRKPAATFFTALLSVAVEGTGDTSPPQEADVGPPRPPSQIFASGRRDPAPTVRSGGQGVWEGSVPTRSSRALAPPSSSGHGFPNWFDDYMADLERHRQIIASMPCRCCRCSEDNS